MKKTILLALSLFCIASGSVDIVGCPSGTYVVWEQNGMVRLADIQGVQDTLEFGLYSPCLGFTVMDGESRLILTTSDYDAVVDDSLFLIDPSPLNVVSRRSVASTDLCWLSETGFEEGSIRAARHQNQSDEFYISADAYLPISGGMECNVMSAGFTCDTAGNLYITDTLGVSIDSYAGSINSYTRPVCCGTSPPTMLWSWHNGYMTPLLDVFAGVHVIDGDPVQGDFEPMLHNCFHDDYCDGQVRAIGSCSSAVLGFWTTNDNQELYCSVLQPGSCIPDSSAAAPYGIPVLSQIAMSANPDDDGLLAIWQSGDEIICAHWDGEWNDYCHVVATGVQDLYDRDLAVCSVDSGYFAAWSTPDVPQVIFIPRDIVTSVEPHDANSSSQLEVEPNPVVSGTALTVTLQGSLAAPVEIYDLSGRLVIRVESGDLESVTIDTSGLCPGTYLISSGIDGDRLTRKIVVLY